MFSQHFYFHAYGIVVWCYMCRAQLQQSAGEAALLYMTKQAVGGRVRVTCDVGYLCANFGLPRLL